MDLYELTPMTPGESGEVRQAIASLRTLGDLLEWARRLDPPVTAPVVVTQDEYTHDVLIPHSTRRWLAFDTT